MITELLSLFSQLGYALAGAASGAMETLHGISRAGGLGDFVYYALIYDYVQDQIREIGPDIMGRTMGIAATSALLIMTVWILFHGYRIMTGQYRDSLAAFVLKTARIAFIIIVASSMALIGENLQEFISEDMAMMATELVTGEYESPSEMIEQNMVAAQLVMSSIDAVNVSENGSISLANQKDRAIWMAGFGAVGPAVTAGALLLMYEVALALFIGLGPIFILFLISDKTSQMFWRWLWYGVGIVFSMGVLVLMSGIVLKVVAAVGVSFWASAGLGAAVGSNLTQGMNTLAMQQGGIGLLMTLLLISVPPIAANFFQGSVGNFMHFSAFGQGRPGANPGESGYRPPPVNSRPQQETQRADAPSVDPRQNSQIAGSGLRNNSFEEEGVRSERRDRA